MEIGAFVITVIVLGYIGLKKGDGSMFQRIENVQIIDNAKEEGGEKQIREYDASKDEENVEDILAQIANQHASGVSTYKEERQLEKVGMSEDELRYLDEVKRKNQKNKSTNSADWFSILRGAHKTYSSVKTAFEEAGIEVDLVDDDVSSALVNEVAARTFSAKMNDLFGIPEEETRAFAKKGEKALSDWARFVEEQKQ